MKFVVDLLPVLLFFAAYHLYDIYVATAAAIAAAVIQAGVTWIRHRRVETAQQVTLGLLLVFGGLTLALRDPDFIKWKPTVVNWLFAAAFFVSGLILERNLLRRIMDHSISLPERVWQRLNWAWVGFFLLLGATNLFVAYRFPEPVWVNFKLFGLTGLTLLFVIGQGIYMARHLPASEPLEK
jgi:intracellular septation protein